MTAILDQEKIQTALDQAAALSSNRDAQAGRIVEGIEDVALRLQRESLIALVTLATINVANTHIAELQSGLEKAGGWEVARTALRSLMRDLIMNAMRISDDAGPNRDRETFVRFAIWLHEHSDSEISALTGAQEEAISAGRHAICACVPLTWAQTSQLSDTSLLELRNRFRPIRDRILAHAMDYSMIDLSTDVPKIGEFVRVCAMLADAAALVVNINRPDSDEYWQKCLTDAERFWEAVLIGSAKQGA
jgi:hypothetical protein